MWNDQEWPYPPCTSATLAVRDPLEVNVNWKALGGFAIANVCLVGRTARADMLLCSGCWIGYCRYQLYINVYNGAEKL